MRVSTAMGIICAFGTVTGFKEADDTPLVEDARFIDSEDLEAEHYEEREIIESIEPEFGAYEQERLLRRMAESPYPEDESRLTEDPRTFRKGGPVEKLQYFFFRETNTWDFSRQDLGANTVWKSPGDAFTNSADFDPSLPTKVIIHGFNTDIKEVSTWGPGFQEAYATAYPQGVNMIMVDASAHLIGGADYVWAALNTQDVGYQTALVVRELERKTGVDLSSKLHCIGFSLGSHTCARFARTYNAFQRRKIAKLTALDPAGPSFQRGHILRFFTVSKEAAEYVEGVHTNSIIDEFDSYIGAATTGFLGLGQRVGHVDYYVNGGRAQPGCPTGLFNSCPHSRAPLVYQRAIKQPFAGESCANFDACYCVNGAECTGRSGDRSPSNVFLLGEGQPEQDGISYVRTSSADRDYSCTATLKFERDDGEHEICFEDNCVEDSYRRGSGRPSCREGYSGKGNNCNREQTCDDGAAWEDGTPCSLDSTCHKCKNPATYWYAVGGRACGEEPCWKSGEHCVTTCDDCCNGHTRSVFTLGVGFCK